MPNRCCVFNCRGNYSNGPKVTTFRFPKDPILKMKWIKAIKRSNFSPTNSSRVCELHFNDELIERKTTLFKEDTAEMLEAPLRIPRLLSGAIPCKYIDNPYNPENDERFDVEIEVKQEPEKIMSLDDAFKKLQESVPDPWIIKKTENYISFVYIKEDPLPNVESIAFINNSLELSFHCDNLEIKSLIFADKTTFKFPVSCPDFDTLIVTLAKLASYVETRQKKKGRFIYDDSNFLVLEYTPFKLRRRSKKPNENSSV